MKRGATDYVLKDLLDKLPLAIDRVLDEVREHETRQLAEMALRESEELHRLTLNNISDAVFITDDDGLFKYICLNVHIIFGYSYQEVQSMGNIAGLLGNDFLSLKEFESLNEISIEWDITDKTGSIHSLLVNVKHISIKGGTRLFTCCDITSQKQAEEKLFRLNRELHAINNCHQALLRAVNEETLLNDICRIICDEAGYRLVCVGYAEHDAEKTIRPVAWRGFDNDYIANLSLSWADESEHGQGPAGRVIRSGEMISVQDFSTDPLVTPWRENALKRGYHSGIALPLKDESENVFGVLLIYSSDACAITTDETRLLAKLAGDLAYGVMALRTRAERKQAENALRQSDEEKTIVNQIANIFLTLPDEAMYWEILLIVLRVVKSRFGLFGYIDEAGDLFVPSLTGEVWDQCQVPGKTNVFLADSWDDMLWGKAIREKRSFNSDGPFRTPQGHIIIEHFLAVPIIFGSETIGLLAVANREGGYDENDLKLLENIAGFISPILNARLQRDRQEKRRIQAEEALRESEQKYRLLVTNASEAIFIIQDGVIKFPNTKTLELSGYTAEELEEIPFDILIHPSERDSVIERNMQRFRGEKYPETIRFRIIDKQGKQIWAQLSAAQINWEGKPGILCFLKDISEEKKLEAQFLQAQKMEALGLLAGGVAHDFNNLLQVILGFIDVLEINLGNDPENEEPIKEVRGAAEQAADLTQQLLAFSRRQFIQPITLDLNDVVQGELKMIRRVIGENIELCYIPGDQLCLIYADKGQIEQVLMNLCVNTRDAMPNGGTLTIETGNSTLDNEYCREHPWAAEGSYVLLRVTDTGIGMDEATLSQIFEPFFTTKGIGEGTGLGLATVYGIVKQHNGLIHVCSELGKGTTFNIYIPITERSEEAIESEIENHVEGGTETILVAEDERAVRNLVGHLLRSAGYTVLTACNGEEALRIFEENSDKIDLVFLDVMMPKLSGHDVMNHIQAEYPKMLFLFSSGYSQSATHANFVVEKGLRLITKPYHRTVLLRVIREIFDTPQSF